MKRSASLRGRASFPCLLIAPVVVLALGTYLSVSHAETSSLPSYVEYGKASWYGQNFHGKPTASGEISHMSELTAAHRTAPLGTHAIVTNLRNGHAVRVRINDRGPHSKSRVLDLSYEAARILDMVAAGIAHVKIAFLPETSHKLPAYTIQVGAYNDLSSAIVLQKRLAAQYTQVWTTRESKRPQLYQVSLGLFEHRDAAEGAARQITLQGYPATILSLH